MHTVELGKTNNVYISCLSGVCCGFVVITTKARDEPDTLALGLDGIQV